MELIIIKSEDNWNSFASENGSSFLQSWQWGEILIAEGKEVERLAVVENGETVAEAQVVYSKLPLGMRHGFCPGGPAFVNFKFQISNFKTISNDKMLKVIEVLEKYLKSKKCIFFRIEPQFHNFTISQFQKVIDVTPRATTELDLTKSDEDLLVAMHEKTRYNIRLAERKDLKIERLKDFGIFWELMKKTGERDGFRLHDKAHYKAILLSQISYQLSVITDHGSSIASAIFVGFADTFTYLFGASDHEYRSLMAPYLIQWEGIKMARKLGFKKYDFFGIAPNSKNQETDAFVIPNPIRMGEESLSQPKLYETEIPRRPRGLARDDSYEYDPKHQYAGVTRFKLGFGGEVSENPGTYDLIISPWKYRIYQALRTLRRLV